nr:Methyltransferase type 11 [Ipomoea batatas]
MGKTGRDCAQIYAIYGVDDWQTTGFLVLHAVFFSALSVVFLVYFEPICVFFERLVPGGSGAARFAAGFTGSVTALSAVCLFYAAGNMFYSSVALRWEMAQKMVGAVGDWAWVKHALDLGCDDRGILLNAVALQLKKAGSSGRVVGLHPAGTRSLAALRTACMEGVQEYVTCRAGDPRRVPFGDGAFDVVVSAAFVHKVVRVLKPGGVGVVWDLVHVPEYVKRLHELKMEEIRVSERVTAFMVSSHMVSFRKPNHPILPSNQVTLDWRFNDIC